MTDTTFLPRMQYLDLPGFFATEILRPIPLRIVGFLTDVLTSLPHFEK